MWGIVFIALGFNFFSLIGALGGLLAGFFNGWRMEHEAVGARARALADAECKMKEAEQIWNELRNEPQLFSQREAATGQPDSGGRLRAAFRGKRGARMAYLFTSRPDGAGPMLATDRHRPTACRRCDANISYRPLRALS